MHLKVKHLPGMTAVILQNERPQLGVLTSLGLRQTSLFICNSNGQEKELKIHLTNYLVGIWLFLTCLIQLQYLLTNRRPEKRDKICCLSQKQ